MPIKSYSPELIVHGCLRSSTALRDAGDTGNTEHERQADAVSKWFPALSALVVGPGLGRDETLQSVAALVIERAVAARLPCVIDADGLRVVMERPELIAGSQWTVLTPNRPEFGRMREKFALSSTGEPNPVNEAAELAKFLNGPVIVRKGEVDVLSDSGGTALQCSEVGCLKRCGGQGDVLAGSIATLLGWAHSAGGRLPDGAPPAPMLAAYAGCMLTRRFAAAAFAKQRRAMTAPDLIEAIGAEFERFAPAEPVEPLA